MSIDTSGIANKNSSQFQQSQVQDSRSNSMPADLSKAAGVSTENAVTESVQQAAQVEQVSLSKESLEDAVAKMNELMQSSNRSLRFSVDDTSEKLVIKVMDVETEEVVRQIPSEETLKFSEFLEGMVGLIFDEQV